MLRIACAILLTGLVLACGLSGCQQPQPTTTIHTLNEGPVAYGANGLSAPAVYKIAPRAPKTMGYPEFAVAEVPVGERPYLPPVEQVFPENAVHQREPILSGVNPDLVAQRPLAVDGLNPKMPMPVEQEVWGGAYGEKGAETAYLYQEGDKIAIEVRNQPEFNGSAVVAADGKIKIPGTEDYVQATGLDAHQIQVAVARTLRPYVRTQPVVRISPEMTQGGYYTIFGGVKEQGRFPMGSKPIRLSEAVFRADSGLLEQARTLNSLGNDKARVGFEQKKGGWLGEVVLVTPHRSYPEVSLHNVAKALFGGKQNDDPILKPGQIIIVRDRSNAELEGYIQRILAGQLPGAQTIKPVPLSKPIPVVTQPAAPVVLPGNATAYPAQPAPAPTAQNDPGLLDRLLDKIKNSDNFLVDGQPVQKP